MKKKWSYGLACAAALSYMPAYNVDVQAQVEDSVESPAVEQVADPLETQTVEAEVIVDSALVQQEAEAEETDAAVDNSQFEGQSATDSTLYAESTSPTVRFYSMRSAVPSNPQTSEKEQALAQWKSIPKREKGRDGLDYFTSDGYVFTPESVVEVYETAFNAKHDDHYHYVPFSDLEDYELENLADYWFSPAGQDQAVIAEENRKKAEEELAGRDLTPELVLRPEDLPHDLMWVSEDRGTTFVVPHGDHFHYYGYDMLSDDVIKTTKWLLENPDKRPQRPEGYVGYRPEGLAPEVYDNMIEMEKAVANFARKNGLTVDYVWDQLFEISAYYELQPSRGTLGPGTLFTYPIDDMTNYYFDVTADSPDEAYLTEEEAKAYIAELAGEPQEGSDSVSSATDSAPVSQKEQGSQDTNDSEEDNKTGFDQFQTSDETQQAINNRIYELLGLPNANANQEQKPEETPAPPSIQDEVSEEEDEKIGFDQFIVDDQTQNDIDQRILETLGLTGSTSTDTNDSQADPHNFEDQMIHWAQEYGITEDDLWDAIDPLFGQIQQVDQGQFLPNQVFKHGDRYFDLADGAIELSQAQAAVKAGLNQAGIQDSVQNQSQEKPKSVQLLEQVYALPPSNQRGSRGNNTAGTRHVEGDGLVFNPTDITRVTNIGYVIPHDDHFHVIPKSLLNDLEIAAAEAVLADRAENREIDYPSDPNPDANDYVPKEEGHSADEQTASDQPSVQEIDNGGSQSVTSDNQQQVDEQGESDEQDSESTSPYAQDNDQALSNEDGVPEPSTSTDDETANATQDENQLPSTPPTDQSQDQTNDAPQLQTQEVEKPRSVELLEQLYALPPSSQRGSRGDNTTGTRHVEGDGLVFNPTEIEQVTPLGYVIPHGDHFHVISKSWLNDLEIAAAEAVLADRAAGLNVDYPTDPNPDANAYVPQEEDRPSDQQSDDQPSGQGDNEESQSASSDAQPTEESSGSDDQGSDPSSASTQDDGQSQADDSPQSQTQDVEQTSSVELLEQLYALPPARQRGNRQSQTAGTRHVEADGLVFNPTDIVRVTPNGYVIPHGDHFHVISKSWLNDLEIAAAEAVLADRAAGRDIDYPTDPNPDANVYEAQLALQAGQSQIEDQANTAKEDTDSQDQNIQTGQALASSSATLSANESQAKSKGESSSQDSQALPQTGSSSLLLASFTSLMAGAWSLVRRKNK